MTATPQDSVSNVAASRDKLAAMGGVAGAIWLVAGCAELLLSVAKAPGMTALYTAYMLLVLLPLMQVYLVWCSRHWVERAIQDPKRYGLSPKPAISTWLRDPLVVAPYIYWIVYPVPVIISACYWPQARLTFDTAPLAPYILGMGLAYLSSAHMWRHRVRVLLLQRLRDVGFAG